MPLSDTAIKNAKPSSKAVKLADEKGLFLLISPAGGKWWRLKYRYLGKEKLLSFGTYPEVSLKDARGKRDEARKLLAAGVDPSENRKAMKAAKLERAANSFEVVAREWFAKHSTSWAATNANKILARLVNDAFPWIGGRPISEISPPELLAVLRRVESRGALESAHRIRGYCGQIFRYAIACGRAERDPSADLRGALPPANKKHLAAVTEPKQVAELLRKFDSYQGTLVVQSALRIAPLIFVRPGELRQMEWASVDLDAAEWRYQVSKTNTQHIVPLSVQAISILRELHLLTGHGKYVFPGARSNGRPMSDNAILAAMRTLEIPKEEMSGHGFRAMARTILDEVLGVRVDFIEHQLAHAVKDPNGRAYNRTAHLAERRKMMQLWADYLDKLKAGAEIVPFDKQRILIALSMDVIVQHVLAQVHEQNVERIEPVFDQEYPIGSTGKMRTWYSTKHCEETTKSQINYAVADSTWEQYTVQALEQHTEVLAYAKNDHLGFQIYYLWNGSRRRFIPDFIIRLANGKNLILETKGQDSDQNKAKRSTLDAWVGAVNSRGGFGVWCWDVAFEPAKVHDIIVHHANANVGK